jgi:anthranilate synthase component 1
MPHRPNFSEFRALLGQGVTVAPVTREIVADGLTPVVAYATAARGDTGPTYLLESVVGGEKWARYSFVGVDCDLRVQSVDGAVAVVRRDGAMEVLRADCSDDPWAAFRTLMRRHRPARVRWLPRFWGGAVGYVTYDAARRFEPKAFARSTHAVTGLPEFSFAVGGTLLVFDALRQTVRVVVPAHVPDGADARAAYDAAVARVDAMVRRLEAHESLRVFAPPRDDAFAELPPSSFDEPSFCAVVERVREHIRAGDAFQVVLSQRFRVPAAGADALDVYRALRVTNPSPYMFFLRFPEVRIAGASPETLVRVEDEVAELRPIAGTRHRGIDDAEDARIEAELRADPKELAEHTMLVDLGRNDLGRIAVPGSVRVTDRMTVERYSHVMHLVSNVRGRLRPDCDALDVLRATFPAGTLSGAPKVRAMEIIDALEPERRGVYGGAVGYLGWDGKLDMAIAIRTLVEREGVWNVQAGAGVVEASDARAEYRETVNKARAALTALNRAIRRAGDGPGGAEDDV